MQDVILRPPPRNANLPSSITSFVAGNVSRQIVPSAENRRSITFASGSQDDCYFRPDQAATTSFGMPVKQNQITLTREIHGDLVTRAWHVITGGASVVVCALEAFDGP